MHRRVLLGLALAGLPAAVSAQPRMTEAQRRQFHDEVLSRDYGALPPGAQARVAESFRGGTPDIGDEAIRQRWDSMTPGQRGEVLTMHERWRGRGPGGGRGPGPGGRGPGPGGGPGRGPGPGPGPGPGRARPPG